MSQVVRPGVLQLEAIGWGFVDWVGVRQASDRPQLWSPARTPGWSSHSCPRWGATIAHTSEPHRLAANGCGAMACTGLALRGESAALGVGQAETFAPLLLLEDEATEQ